MTAGVEVMQAFNVVPARLGQIIALAVDATSRGYDLTALLWNGVTAVTKAKQDEFFLSFEAETNDVYFGFSGNAPGADTILDTTITAAGGTPALDAGPTFTSAQCAKIVNGLPPVDYRIVRTVDKTLIVKCAAGKTATLRFWTSSKSVPGVV